MRLPLYVRAKVAEEFQVKKIRPIHVANNVVIDDGYNIIDIEKILNVETLQNFLKIKATDPEILLSTLKEWADDIFEIKEEVLPEVKTTTNAKKTK